MNRNRPEPLVRIVDDDPTVCASLSFILKLHGFEAVTYGSALEFLQRDSGERPGCLILDVRMPQMTGLELFGRLRERAASLPVIFLTGHGDIEMAVDTLRNGAFDFLTKPPEPEKLAATVSAAINRDILARRRRAEHEQIVSLVETLTPAEKNVAQLVANGLQTKVIAQALGVSEQTVKMHRLAVYRKLDAVNPVEVSQIMSAYNATPEDA